MQFTSGVIGDCPLCKSWLLTYTFTCNTKDCPCVDNSGISLKSNIDNIIKAQYKEFSLEKEE